VTAAAPAFAGLIAALGSAAAAHAADDEPGLRRAMGGLDTALDGLTELRAGLDARTARLEAVGEEHRSGIAYLDEVIARITDADLSEVLTRLGRDQAGLEATYLTMSRLASMSLADYLR
jgi:flagellin-like hook-associated protein FlgL